MSLILTLDTSGTPYAWSTWQDAVVYKTKNLVSWGTGDVEFTFSGGISRQTGQVSVITVPSIIAIKSRHSHTYRPPTLTNRNLFRRDLMMCAYCGKTCLESNLTRDHIQPVSRGGADTWMNVVTACWKCNNRKDDNLLSELNMDLLYVPYVPSRIEHLILQNRKILADQMAFLCDMIPPNSRIHRLM